MAYFPMMVDLESKRVLVIGGGEEGKKKVEILYQFGAVITLIAINAKDEAKKLAATYEEREFEDRDILENDYTLIVAATDDEELNSHISELAAATKTPVNIVDNSKLCTFIFPAIIKKGDVVCSVSSGGKSPYVAQYVKSLIEEVLPKNIAEINDKMGEYRIKAKQELENAAERRAYLKLKFEELLNK